MSTQHFMSRIRKGPGRFTFAMLLGVLLALLWLSPATVFARTSGQKGAASFLASPSAVLTKVGVSVVRLVATYGANQVTCTGLGVLVASQAPSGALKNYTNWVLADGNLVSTKMTTCGKLGDTLSLSSLEIWAGSEYTGGSTVMLGSLTCRADVCSDGLSVGLPDAIMLPQTAEASYTLFSFQSVAGEPYVGLSSATDAAGVNIGLTNPAITKGMTVYPYKNVDATNSPPANYKDFLTPAIVSDPPASQTGVASSAAGQPNPIEGGTPEVDAQGQLIGMWVNKSGNGYTILPVGTFQDFLHSHGVPPAGTSIASVQDCTVAACWNSGIDAYSAADYKTAHTDLSAVSKLNKQFIAAQTYDALASKHLSSDGASRPVTPPASQPASPLILGLFSLEEVILAALILIILIVLLAWIMRIRKHRRELAKFDAEVEESRRLAAEQMAQQRTPRPQPSQAACPNCHNLVSLTDTTCPTCRYPLSPSASGLGVRLAGNAPRVSAPLPPPSSAISDVPTVQMLPSSPIPASAEVSEPTMKRAQFQTREESTQQNIQQVRGRNLSLAVGTLSDPGIKRKHKPNEDSMFAFQWDRTHDSRHQQFGLFVVADGMGGHANGQDASRLAIQTMIDFMLPKVISGTQTGDDAFLGLMGDGVQAANQAVHGRNMESHADMGTTMTAALVVGATAYVANVGDSRTYLYREGQGLSKVTHDHSVVASLVDAGIIKPDDIYTHPKRNQIYRSLGEKPVVEVDTFPVNLLPGDKLLLCSDGLWDMVRDPLIEGVLGKTTSDPNETGQKLIKAALEGGGEDNVSVIVVQFAEMNARTGMTGVQLLAKPETVTVPNLPPI